MTFGPTSTADDVIQGVDLTGKTAVITGASGGIGLETARALASAGATVVLGNRNQEKSKAASADILSGLPDAQIELGELDLTSLNSVRKFASWVDSSHKAIDLLITNAGVMATPLDRTQDGFELQFGTNHLSHFLLTNLLTPNLLAAESARFVGLSSSAHFMNGIHWEDPNYNNSDYDAWSSYAQSKSANILFAVELERRLGAQGVHAFAVHPGVVATDLDRHLDDQAKTWVQTMTAKQGLLTKTPEQGAATTVFAATATELANLGGSYLDDCQVASSVAPHATDPEEAKRLWSLSEDLIGETFNP